MRSFAGRRAWEVGRHQMADSFSLFYKERIDTGTLSRCHFDAGAEKFRTEVWREISRLSVSIKSKVLTAHTGMSLLEMTMGAGVNCH